MRRTGPISSRAPALLLATALAGCGGRASPATPGPGVPEEEVIGILHASADAWNRGDIEGFLHPYHQTPELTFVGSTGILRGFATLRGRYQGGYFDAGLPPRLSFGDLEIRALGGSNALMLGRYTLEDRASGAVTSTGIFSLVWGLTPEGWRILHDHTSETSPP